MDWNSFAGVVPVASAVGAAVGGVISFVVNWWWKVHELTDKIQVHFGGSSYDETPGYGLYVVSRRKHPMELRDYGFVLSNGRLLSAPVLWGQGEGGEHDASTPTRMLPEVNSRFEISIDLGFSNVIGAYARTTTQHRPTIAFSRWFKVGLMTKLRIRFKQFFRPTFD